MEQTTQESGEAAVKTCEEEAKEDEGGEIGQRLGGRSRWLRSHRRSGAERGQPRRADAGSGPGQGRRPVEAGRSRRIHQVRPGEAGRSPRSKPLGSLGEVDPKFASCVIEAFKTGLPGRSRRTALRRLARRRSKKCSKPALPAPRRSRPGRPRPWLFSKRCCRWTSRARPSSGGAPIEAGADRAERLLAGLNEPQRAGGGPRRGPAAGPRRRRLGQDPGADPPHRLPAGDRRGAPGRDPRDHLHQQGGERDARAGRRR